MEDKYNSGYPVKTQVSLTRISNEAARLAEQLSIANENFGELILALNEIATEIGNIGRVLTDKKNPE